MKRCYFAYTWEDEKVFVVLKFLKAKIEDFSDGEIEVVFDRESFKVAENFEEKEKLICRSDSISIFFSPAYKKAVEIDMDKNRGVYREYQHILKVREQGISTIIPIVIEGEESQAITKEFRKNIADKYDIDDMFEGVRGKTLKRKYKNRLIKLARKIVKETELANRKRDYEFSSREEMIEVLFGESYANHKLPQKCMYKTEAYNMVMSQSRKFIVGRKGSGKSTFFELLERCDADEFLKKFKILKPIKADDFMIDNLYGVVNFVSKDKELFPMANVLETFWEIYMYLTASYIVCLEEEHCMIDDERSKIFKKIGDVFRKEKFNVDKLDYEKWQKGIFTSSVDALRKFLETDILDFSKEDSYETSLVANFTVDNIMKRYFGKNNYNNLKNAIMQCKKYMMIALDGFDRIGDDYRQETALMLNSKSELDKEQAKERLKFETIFFRSMFSTVQKLGERKNGIMKRVSYCIIVPKDRIDQMRENDRDFSKYNFTDLSWDAIDLLEMIVKRLEYVFNINAPNTDNLQERFVYVMKKNLNNIPLEINIKIGEKLYAMDLFIYLLRLSFWNPRDIIKYLYELYWANKNSKKMLDSETVKDILSKKASDIIVNEFYHEYKNVIVNIKDIMECFRDKDILIDLNEMLELLSKQEFLTVMINQNNTPQNKLCLLYELGVVGIKVTNSVKMYENLKSNICFNYNEGLEPLEVIKKDKWIDKEQIQILINPIFEKKLRLNFNTDEIIEKYEWKYLEENHVRKNSIARI